MKKIRLDIACNDPDHGIFNGMARAIHIGSVEFNCRSWDWAPKLTEGEGWIRIGEKKLRCSGSTYGVGNWCWNAFFCDRDDVEALLNWPKFRKWFDMESGPVGLYNKWETGKPLRFKKQPTAGGAQ